MKRRSPLLFFIALTLLIFVGVSIVLFEHFSVMIKNDASTINRLGVIRGSIQRLSKLEMIHEDNDEIRNSIDSLIARDINMDIPYLEALDQKWTELKKLMIDYRNDPSQENMELFTEKSEECWLVADQMLLENQNVSEKKLSYLTLPIILLGLGFFTVFVLLVFVKKYVYDNLEVSAIYDPLTKIFNRRYFLEYLNNEILRSERKNTEFCLFMFDIDFFKKVNDSYGHAVGDDVIKNVTGIVQKTLRKSDVLCRFGGEEFTVLLPDTTIKEAVKTAERSRINIERYRFREVNDVTVSIGVTSYQKGDAADEILKRADTALYLAKNNGRNRTETA